ncbi:MAG: peptide ABC transporter substrate-binding protein [Planctomycetes bacterium]|nr:peptide ABC transporter substrate-binding protein [Planctomycetota bacterium]NOG53348.1 peptide ABC transporter substrate-binding protein [Planctomycetota bacterium]
MIKLLVPVIALFGLMTVVFLLDRPEAPADLVFVNRGECHTLDPQRMSWMQDFRMANALYEGLVRWNNDTFAIEPGVAESWDVSDDRLTYTFHLRDTAKWSNQDPVTAHDFVYSWKRALYPDAAADYTDLFYKIEGGEDFFKFRQAQLEQFRQQVSELSNGDEAARLELARQLYEEAEAKFDEIVALKAVNDYTLTFTLANPTPYMLDLCAFGVFCPVHPPTVEQYVSLDPLSGMINQEHGWTKPPSIVTNGPYVLTRWRYKRDMRLERNPHYWNLPAVKAKSVLSLSVEEPSTAVLAFETGTIDWLSDVSGVDYRPDMLAQARRYLERHATRYAQLESQDLGYGEIMATLAAETPPGPDERNNIHAFPAFGTYFYNFNCQESLPDGRPNPFFDPRVRRAFAMAIDKSDLVTRVTRLNQPIASTFIPPGSIPGYHSPAGLGHDPDQSRTLLAEAGWELTEKTGTLIKSSNGEPFPMVEILYSTGQDHEDIAQAIAFMWENELGITASLVGKESKTFGEDVKHHKFMISRANWFGDYGDPTTFLDLFRSTNQNNDRAFANDWFDQRMHEIDRELDEEQRTRLCEEAERFIVEEQLPLIPLFHRITVYMYEPDQLHHIATHPRLVQYLWELEAVH